MHSGASPHLHRRAVPEPSLHIIAVLKIRYIIYGLVALSLAACHSSKPAVIKGDTGSASSGRQPSSVVSSDKKSGASNDPDKARSIIKEARKWIGTPYKYGGKSRKGTDCSGMVMTVFDSALGIKLPRSSREQHKFCREVPCDAIEPGDLVFFGSVKRSGSVNHVGLYIGNGKMIHASTSRGVMESSVNEAYWRERFYAVGRIEAITTKGKGAKIADATPATPRAKPPVEADTAAVLIKPATRAIELPDSVLYDWLD